MKPCENWNGEHHEESEHHTDRQECRACSAVFCGPCREAITGSKTICPGCNLDMNLDPEE